MLNRLTIEGQLVDIHEDRIYPARLEIESGHITDIIQLQNAENQFLLPGLVDAHVHVESSMLPPAEFARMAVVHGTVATVSDPHEIANVLGKAGVDYMLDDAKGVPFKFCFGAPSCVPATGFENAGATLNAASVREILENPLIGYLSEVMNYPGVLGADPDLMAKIAAAKALGKPVDGHATGLRGEMAARYAAAGISTDHECVSLEEALDKLACGMKILIREGSAARNFEALIPLILSHPEQIMFCSDDKHPNDLVHGHINQLVARAVAFGGSVMDAVRAASFNPAQHYRLPVGLLRTGDPADVVTVRDLKNFEVTGTWIDGVQVSANGKSLLQRRPSATPNQFAAKPVNVDQLRVLQEGSRINTIVVHDGQIVTGQEWVEANPETTEVAAGPGKWQLADPSRDLLKLVVLNRYKKADPAMAFVKGFGLKTGAIASTVAHDSHNIIAVGVEDANITAAINALMESGGGISLANSHGKTAILPLSIAGLMSTEDGWEVARLYEILDAEAKKLGATLAAPYMSLSFLALLVIPKLKLSDLGLFDGEAFRFCDLFKQ